MMDSRRGVRRRGDQTLLPLRRATRHFSNTVSCWYCDFKCMAFNDLLYRFGRRHSRLCLFLCLSFVLFLGRFWFVGAIVFLRVSAGTCASGSPLGSDLAWLPSLGLQLLFFVKWRKHPFCMQDMQSPVTPCLGFLFCEGVQIEYIALFLALVFPGALVAFNDASLQLLPGMASLRIYCAGIWHNAAFSGLCTLALFLLPFILSPLFIHGENPMVLDVHSVSPVSGYLSPYDVILSLDEFRVNTAEEWKQKIAVLANQTPLLSFGQSNEIEHVQKSYCVPHSLIQKSIQVPFTGDETYCPNELFAFAPITCPDISKFDDGGNKTNHQNTGESIHCLNAKDVIKLKKCAYDTVQVSKNNSGCLCSEDESCLMPVQLPGLGWVEITYSRLECLNHGRSLFRGNQSSNSRERGCLQTFVFVGDLISMAHSVHLTSYQPRLSMYFIAYLPDLFERFFTCAFHVSMALALLNSLPVFFLDGESILEATLVHYFGFLSSRMKQSVLRCCLYGGTFICTFLILRMIFVSVR